MRRLLTGIAAILSLGLVALPPVAGLDLSADKPPFAAPSPHLVCLHGNSV